LPEPESGMTDRSKLERNIFNRKVSMDQRTFEQFCGIVYEKSGISINANKIALVTARVGKRMRELGLQDEREYLKLVLGDSDGEEIVHLLDVISTNVTSFFRESAHFDFFAKAILEWYSQGQRRFRFWCAAASTGEEPYSIGMTFLEKMGNTPVNMKILATDISTRALAQCMAAVYSKSRLSGVPASMASRFFLIRRQGKDALFEVNKDLKSMIAFSRLNLSKPPFPMQGPFDAIFCRNVMIYFDNTVRQHLLAECFRLLRPQGYLFVGHAESLTGLISEFKIVKPSIYVKPD
jgi:chemotaxis protein methyltransferase CheR